MIVFGIMLFARLVPLSVVADIWVSLSPGGSWNSPTPIPPATAVVLEARLRFRDEDVGFSGDPTLWRVYVRISNTSYRVPVSEGGKTATVVEYELYDTYVDMGKPVAVEGSTAIWRREWVSPRLPPNTVLRFWWEVIVIDEERGTVSKHIRTTYAVIQDMVPVGTLLVNGVDSRLTWFTIVSDPTVRFEFRVEKNWEYVREAYVEVVKVFKVDEPTAVGKVRLSGSGSTYTGTFTLPDYGVYTVKLYVEWYAGTWSTPAFYVDYPRPGTPSNIVFRPTEETQPSKPPEYTLVHTSTPVPQIPVAEERRVLPPTYQLVGALSTLAGLVVLFRRPF